MPHQPEELDLRSPAEADDVDAHLLKEALASAAVAGALFAGTAQAKNGQERPAASTPTAHVQASTAHAATLTFDGGTPAERAQVTRALVVSSFDWGILPPITVHITASPLVEATPGEVWLQQSLLDSGKFSWGVVQHEFAHQVDFFFLDDAAHDRLTRALGGTAWCEADAPGLKHSDYTCERFASTLAWAFWQSPDNCMRPTGRGDLESGSMSPAAFKALLAELLP